MEAKMKNSLIKGFIVLAFLFLCKGASSEPVYPVFRESATQVNILVPKEQRDEKYINFLSASVKISVNGSAGSGTICYFDPDSEWAYVVSCGHLWNGNMKYQSQNKEKAKIIVWYKNSKKLLEPASYDAEVLFWSNQRGYDSSLLRFRPDWSPNYFPIASNFNPEKGQVLNSMGCDGGKEVARYEVKFVEFKDKDLTTELNSPRPGRSGGGLITNEGQVVGICWGTSDISGSGIGYFTPISSIKKVFANNKHEWILHKKEVQNIPIYDWSNPKKQYEKHFVPMPNFLLF